MGIPKFKKFPKMAPNAGRCGCQNYLFVVKKSTRREFLSFLNGHRHFWFKKSLKMRLFFDKIFILKDFCRTVRGRQGRAKSMPIWADTHKVARKKT